MVMMPVKIFMIYNRPVLVIILSLNFSKHRGLLSNDEIKRYIIAGRRVDLNRVQSCVSAFFQFISLFEDSCPSLTWARSKEVAFVMSQLEFIKLKLMSYNIRDTYNPVDVCWTWFKCISQPFAINANEWNRQGLSFKIILFQFPTAIVFKGNRGKQCINKQIWFCLWS